jgi:hypothetical protein
MRRLDNESFIYHYGHYMRLFHLPRTNPTEEPQINQSSKRPKHETPASKYSVKKTYAETCDAFAPICRRCRLTPALMPDVREMFSAGTI